MLFADMPFQKKKGLRLSLCKRGSYRRKGNQSIRTPGASPYPKKVNYLSPFKTDISFSNCNKRKFKSPSKVSKKKQISFQAYCNINEIDEPFVEIVKSPWKNKGYQSIITPPKSCKGSCKYSPVPSFRMPKEIIEDIEWTEQNSKKMSLLENNVGSAEIPNFHAGQESRFRSLKVSNEMLSELQCCEISNTNECTDDFEQVIKTANDESCTSIPDELIMLLPNVIRELKWIGKLDIFVKFMRLVNEEISFKEYSISTLV